MGFFKTEPPPEWGSAQPAAPGVRRIVARNPSFGKLHGTNTYLAAFEGGLACIDPGPDLPEHRDAILAAAAGRITHILLTHSHLDHSEGAASLASATGAPVAAFVPLARKIPPPDIALHDGAAICGMTAIHTPGHASDHLCFGRDGLLFSGDLVMAWSSSAIVPPDGSMNDYMASLRRLLARGDRLYLPGHGPAVTNPAEHVQGLVDHRLSREGEIAEAVRGGADTISAIVDRLYAHTPEDHRWAAEAIVRAHLERLSDEGIATETDGVWSCR